LEENNMVSHVASLAGGEKTIVCVVAPGTVLLPFAKEVGAITLQFMPGQEAGSGLADVLFGRKEPMGRLPVTLPFENFMVNFTKEQYPGVGFIRPALLECFSPCRP
jgi:hypothetical protein